MIELSKTSRREVLGEGWDDCCRCGAKYKHAQVWFDSGSAEPTVGEVLTGATSSDTGVVVGTQLHSGTYAGGDAAGVVTLSTLTGASTDSDTLLETVFQNDENLNGSTGGANMMTVNGTPYVNKYGRLYPDSEIVEFRGKRYCREHFEAVWKNKLIDENIIDINEDDRGTIW